MNYPRWLTNPNPYAPNVASPTLEVAHQMVADAQALNAKIAAQAAVIRNSK